MKVKYKATKLLTRPTISMKAEGAECFIKVEGAMFTGKAMKEAEGAKKKDPATLINVVNLENGEESQLVVPAVLKGVFEEDYKGDKYVGKCFHIKNLGKKDTQAGSGQRYNRLLIEEIEVEQSQTKKSA